MRNLVILFCSTLVLLSSTVSMAFPSAEQAKKLTKEANLIKVKARIEIAIDQGDCNILENAISQYTVTSLKKLGYKSFVDTASNTWISWCEE